MMTNPRATTPALRAGQARQRHLQAMLQDHQREMQNVLQRRVRGAPSHPPSDGLDETEHAEADVQEHIEVALIQMKGDTLQRVRDALARLEAGERRRTREQRFGSPSRFPLSFDDQIGL
jgi:hypothetical protein